MPAAQISSTPLPTKHDSTGAYLLHLARGATGPLGIQDDPTFVPIPLDPRESVPDARQQVDPAALGRSTEDLLDKSSVAGPITRNENHADSLEAH